MGTHRDLTAWQKSMELASTVYRHTQQFPAEERFCLTGQMRRAAVSIPANIAEGAARGTGKEFLRFLYIARGSLAELETLALVSSEVGVAEPGSTEELTSAISRLSALIQGLIESVRTKLATK